VTRQELKEQVQHDQFTDTVGSVVNYSVEHRQQVIRWGIALVGALIIIGGILWYLSYAKSIREQDLQTAFGTQEIPVGQPAAEGSKSFPTQDAKNQAAIKAFAAVAAKDGDSREGMIARYYLGTLKVQTGDKSAESDLRAAASSNTEASSLAKIALAQLYKSQNKISEAQTLLRDLVNKPTDLVSKAQAQILLAQLVETSNPQEAKRMLQGLKGTGNDPAVARAADQVAAQMK